MDLINETEGFIIGAKNQLLEKLPELIIGALTLVAGLAWNDAISGIINYYLPQNKEANVWYKLLYAFILTIIIVFLIYLTVTISDRAKKMLIT